MHRKSKVAKAIAASVMAAAMMAPTVASVVTMSASAEAQVLGETSFDHKALPWHTCESSPAKQTFDIDECFHVKIIKAVGAAHEKWDLQVRHRNLDFKAGHKYTVSFRAKASRSGLELCSKIGNTKGNEEYCVVNVDKMQNGPHMDGQWGKAAILTTEWQTISGEFLPSKDLESCEWAFHYAEGTEFEGNAKDGDEIWLDDMSIICQTCGSDGPCAADPNASYGATSRMYSGLENNFVSVNQIGYYPKQSKVAVLGDNQGDVVYGAEKIDLSGTYEFEVVDASSGTVAYTGTSSAVTADADSADGICKLDFTEFQKEGRYYIRIKGKEWRSFEFNIGNDIYSDSSHDMLTNAINYFYQNRSGIDIEEKYITSGDKSTLAHKGGHKTDTATIQSIWKNEYASKEEATSTYASGTLTANGGWYDAGDHGKYVVNGGISVWTLQNMYERAAQTEAGLKKFADGSGTVVVPETGNGVPDILDEAAVELDWMTQMKVTSSDKAWGQYEGLVYHKLHDHKWTGLATKPWDYAGETLSDGSKGWDTVRIVKPPTLTATLNYAACAAQAARLWEPYKSEKAKKYLEEAKAAYEAYDKYKYDYVSTETTHPELGCKCAEEELNEKSLYAPMWHAKGGGPYGDNNAKDDAYWAACEIFVSASKMGDTSAAAEYKKLIDESSYAYKVGTRMVGGENKGSADDENSGSFTSFNWGNTASAGSLTLALNQDLLSDSEVSTLKESILKAADAYIAEEKTQGYGIPYKYDGPDYNDPNNLDPSIMINGYEWGSNSMVINNCIVMAVAYDLTGDGKYMSGVTTGMDYLLGTNPLSFSFITGYGTYHEKNPHHRYWSYELDKTLPMAPDGVLSGGPNAGLQDPYVRALGFVPGETTNPSQRCFVDSIEAWSTNEVTINWNAPLAWIASFLQDEAADAPAPGDTPITPPTTGNGDTPGDYLAGDANIDGEVSVADAAAILQYLGNNEAFPLTEQGIKNGDVDGKDGLTPADAIAIQKFKANLVSKLPL